MSDNLYRTILGAIVLVSLYMDLGPVIYLATAIVLLEGITNWRIPRLVNRWRATTVPPATAPSTTVPPAADSDTTRFSFEAERLFRLTVGGLLLITYSLGSDSMLWFFPWFMGFAILGAGVSGLCPALALFKWLGFR